MHTKIILLDCFASEGERILLPEAINSKIMNTLRNPTGEEFKTCKNVKKKLFRGSLKTRKGISKANKHQRLFWVGKPINKNLA